MNLTTDCPEQPDQATTNEALPTDGH